MAAKKRFKDFGSGSDTPAPPLSFALFGETFDAVPKVQGKLLIELVKKADSEDAAQSATMILGFFEDVLLEESYTRFDALISSTDKVVEVETLAEIVGWLMEEYTNRPEAHPEN